MGSSIAYSCQRSGGARDTHVVLQGARQVGKSTSLAEQIAEERGLVVTLDDADVRTFASDDPAGFVAQFPDGLGDRRGAARLAG